MSEVELPDGTIIEFPDGASAGFISTILRRHSAQGQVLHSIMNPQALEPYRDAVANMALDVMPISGHQRSAGRIEESLAGIGERTPIGQVLSGADIAAEGVGMVADFVPGLKAAGIAGASLLPLMARGSKGVRRFGKQSGSIGSADALPLDEASRIADNERMADIYDYDFPLTHESSSPDFDGTILERPSPSGVFDGVFSMEGLEGAAIGRGGYNHTYYPRKGRVAGPSDSDLDYDKSIDFLKKEFPGADNDEIDTLYELTAEDSNIYELFDDETMYRIRTGDITHPLSDFLPDDLGDASWELQNLRGKIAVSQDFDAIGMSDENGLSYFIPYGSKAKKK